MRGRESGRDNPWVLVGLGALAVVSAMFGLCAWMQILDGAAR